MSGTCSNIGSTCVSSADTVVIGNSITTPICCMLDEFPLDVVSLFVYWCPECDKEFNNNLRFKHHVFNSSCLEYIQCPNCGDSLSWCECVFGREKEPKEEYKCDECNDSGYSNLTGRRCIMCGPDDVGSCTNYRCSDRDCNGECRRR